jgi:hypothetical protein
MPRNMSFMLTTEQIKNRTKTVTRRVGWWYLQSGDIINAIEKGMGLKKGEKVKKICQLRIKSALLQELKIEKITKDECIREGFPEMSPEEFIDFLCSHNKQIWYGRSIMRIEFEYV